MKSTPVKLCSDVDVGTVKSIPTKDMKCLDTRTRESTPVNLCSDMGSNQLGCRYGIPSTLYRGPSSILQARSRIRVKIENQSILIEGVLRPMRRLLRTLGQ